MDKLAAQPVRTTLVALMLAEVLKPVMRDADVVGGYGVSYFAQVLAERLERP